MGRGGRVAGVVGRARCDVDRCDWRANNLVRACDADGLSDAVSASGAWQWADWACDLLPGGDNVC